MGHQRLPPSSFLGNKSIELDPIVCYTLIMDTMNKRSHITVDAKNDHQVFATPDEIQYFQACVLKSGLKLLRNGIKPNANWTLTNTVATIGGITGRSYKRSEWEQALTDISAWIKARQVPEHP